MAWNQRWGGSVIGQDKVNTARYSTARTFSANPFGFSHGQRTVREVSRGTIPTRPIQTSRFTLRERRQPRATIPAPLRASHLARRRRDSDRRCSPPQRAQTASYSSRRTARARSESTASFTNLSRAANWSKRACPMRSPAMEWPADYLASGECPNGAEPVIKVIGALAGDRVDLSPEEIRVNGAALPQSATRFAR